ncbi:MAG: NTP transferase domain-containing protein [Mariprofundales bacterium]
MQVNNTYYSYDCAIVLAAGKGTRLKWLTKNSPKALLNLAGQPLVAHVLTILRNQGVRCVAVNSHYCATLLHNYLGDGSKLALDVRISHEPELLDSGGGIKQALSFLPPRKRVIIHNCDVISNVDIVALAALCPDHGCAISLVKNPTHNEAGDFSLSGTLVQPLCSIIPLITYTYAGIAICDPHIFTDYPDNTPFSFVNVLRDCMRKKLLHGLYHRGRWSDLGRPKDWAVENILYTTKLF